MKTKPSTAKRKQQPLPRKTAATPRQTVYVHRRSATEFSCGMDDRRALLVEESLDERERRG